MKLDSKYFDSIRASRRSQQAKPAAEVRAAECQWRDCARKGEHRAPCGRGRDGEFYMFCEEHVRQYNASYNYFDGMSDVQVAKFQKDSLTGHRPTWKVGANSWAHGTRSKSSQDVKDQFTSAKHASAQDFHAFRAKKAREEAQEARRRLMPLERKALETLELNDRATKTEIKTRFKEMVKKHHPDLNGGDRGAEDRLREIIQAYNYLKQAGHV